MDGYAVNYTSGTGMLGPVHAYNVLAEVQRAHNRRLSFAIDYMTTKATDTQVRAIYARLEPYGA